MPTFSEYLSSLLVNQLAIVGSLQGKLMQGESALEEFERHSSALNSIASAVSRLNESGLAEVDMNTTMAKFHLMNREFNENTPN